MVIVPVKLQVPVINTQIEHMIKKKALYLSVNVLSMKVLIGDTFFTSPNGDGTAILPGHLLAVQREYLHFSVILKH